MTRKLKLKASGFFHLRTPLLPFDEMGAWTAAAGEDGDEAARRGRLRSYLRRAIRRPEVAGALHVASPSLEASLPHWLEDPDSERGRRLERSLVRYVCRMIGRPTPFGLCAAVSLGQLARDSHLDLGESPRDRRATRLDMGFLAALVRGLERHPGVARRLRYRPNPSLYRVAGRLRYVESRPRGSHFLNAYVLSVAEEDEYVARVLELASDGATARELAAGLCAGDPEIDADTAEGFIGQLIDGQLLIADFFPPLTGEAPWEALLRTALGMPDLGDLPARLRAVDDALGRLDEGGTGAPPALYRRLQEAVGRLEVDGHDESKLLQVDLYRDAPELALGHGHLGELQRAVEVLRRFDMVGSQGRLAGFRTAFSARYGERAVPLLEALDDETGIGYGSSELRNAGAEPLLQGLDVGLPGGDPQVPWGSRRQHLLARLSRVLAAGERELVLDENDVELLSAPAPRPLPGAFSVTASLAAESGEALGRGDYRWLMIAGLGPSGIRLVSRFCHQDPRLAEGVQDHLRAEEQRDPEAIFAEIVHLPENPRHANVGLRPLLREHEIPYIGVSGAPPERQIAPSELLVTVEGDRIRLRRSTDGRRVEPRLSSAHAYTRIGGGLYRFLCDLQDQGVSNPVRWEWGPLLDAAFLPRVRIGKVVVSRACWRLGAAEARALTGGAGDLGPRLLKIRRDLGLPRFVVLAGSDKELSLDLDNLLCADVLVDQVRRRGGAALLEMFPAPEDLVVRGAGGGFVHEMVIPFVRPPARAARGAPRPQPARSIPAPIQAAPEDRSFAPGSDWLFASFFASPSSCDRLLLDMVAPLRAELSAEGLLAQWFFLRFDQPDWHLRLRLRARPGAGAQDLLARLHAAAWPFLDDGTVWKMDLGTYEREIERYGGLEGVRLAEKVFEVDSDAVLELLGHLSGGALDERWRLALLGIDSLLSGLGFDLDARAFIATELRRSFTEEHGANIHLKKQLGQRFRPLHDELRRIFTGGDEPPWLRLGRRVFERGHRGLAELGRELHELARAGTLRRTPAQLAAVFVHLHVNRLLRSTHRRQELVLYEFLYRLYQEARTRRRGSKRSDS